VEELRVARRGLEPRIRHPKLLAALRKLDTRCALLLGPTGVGKTSAARWARLRHPGLWVAARALGACERKHPLGEGDPQLMREAIAAPVLYLDDLGSEEPRDVAVLQYVIDQRYAAAPPRATFVTSALTQVALTSHLGTPYVRRLGEQHVPNGNGGEWPVLFVDCHEVKP
jgi:DNA replication protein DnaC